MNPTQKSIMGDINNMRRMGYQTGGQSIQKKKPVSNYSANAIAQAWNMLRGIK